MKKFSLLLSFMAISLLCSACAKTQSTVSNDISSEQLQISDETENMSFELSSETEVLDEEETEQVIFSESETEDVLSKQADEDRESDIHEKIISEETSEKTTEMNVVVMAADIEETMIVTEKEPEVPPITVNNLKVSPISVSCLKVSWDEDPGREYHVDVDTSAPYSENIYFLFRAHNLLYLTGLREGSSYDITVTPIVSEGETAQPEKITGETEKVVVVYNFDEDEEAYAQYKDSGIEYSTNFFTGERASGLTAQPSSGAIAGAINDPITDTGICRDEFGDYCVAMGQYFGHQWDRYLITFQNGQQITVKQCDDKGLKWYHTVGGHDDIRNLVEFIWYGSSAPSGVMYTGTWGAFTWNGLTFDHIQSIQKINYPDSPVEY